MRPLMPTTLFFTDVVGNESVVKGALILVHSLQFRASGLSSTITALSPRTGDCAHVRVLFGGGTVGPPDGGSLTPRFVKEFMSVLVNERSQMHKRLTFLSSIHAPRMANSSLSSYIIKSPAQLQKRHALRGIAFCAWPPLVKQTSTPRSSLCVYFCLPKTRSIPSAAHIDAPAAAGSAG